MTVAIDPAAGSILCGRDRPALLLSTAARSRAIALAFEDIVMAVRDLATARGHILGPAITEAQYNLAIRCERCERWVTINISAIGNGDGGDMGITGRALAACRGTPWGAAERRDEAWPSSAESDGTLTLVRRGA
jgi:hypothetical protein